MHWWSVYMYVCVRVSNHLELGYRQLWADVWALGIEPGSSTKAVWAISLVPLYLRSSFYYSQYYMYTTASVWWWIRGQLVGFSFLCGSQNWWLRPLLPSYLTGSCLYIFETRSHEAGFELLVLLSLSSKGWDYKDITIFFSYCSIKKKNLMYFLSQFFFFFPRQGFCT